MCILTLPTPVHARWFNAFMEGLVITIHFCFRTSKQEVQAGGIRLLVPNFSVGVVNTELFFGCTSPVVSSLSDQADNAPSSAR